MCGRFIFIPNEDEEQFFDSFNIKEQIDLTDSYNVAPTQFTPVVTKNSPNKAQYMHWGLIPKWAKDKKFASRMINARIETVETKPAFRGLVNKQRCLIPANGYYEWSVVDDEKRPFLIGSKNHGYIAMGGLYDAWESPEGEKVYSFTIITQSADQAISHLHDRMPLLIRQGSWDKWLDPKSKFSDILSELDLFKGSDLDYYEVSKKVNSPSNNSPELLVKVTGGDL